MPKKEHRDLIPEEPRGFMAPLEEMERWFDDFFRRPRLGPPWLPQFRGHEEGDITPFVDMYEDGNDVVVKAEIPGMNKENLDVTLDENSITISGEKKGEEKVERKDYYRLERSFGSFRRSLRIPVETETDKATASFKDGILEVRIPKTAAAKQKAKKVSIQ